MSDAAAWPPAELEPVGACPLCGAADRTVAHGAAEDLVFRCAPGRWTYWTCAACASVYLDPRPTPASIGRAYGTYYTHGGADAAGAARARLRRECFWHWYGLPLGPRLGLPGIAAWPLRALQPFTERPLELTRLAALPRGRLVDVGCGDGKLLADARQLGWEVVGLEPDPRAAAAARSRGVPVVEAPVEGLAGLGGGFDAVVCAHVLEHVHRPLALLALARRALRPGGTLFLSCPNAASELHGRFGPAWRGLEAPRHLAIPSAAFLLEYLGREGFRVTAHVPRMWRTCAESLRLRGGRERLGAWDRLRGAALQLLPRTADPLRADYVQVEAVLGGAPPEGPAP